MGEGDRGAGSLHFFVPGPRVRGGCGRSGNGSHAPPGEAGAEAGSLHFLCPTPGEGRLRRGRSGVRNGSEAPSGRAAKGPDGTRKSTGEKSPRAERAATGAEAESETEAKPYPEERRGARRHAQKHGREEPPGGEGRDRSRSGVRNGSEALSGGAARGRTARAKARARREFPGSPILSDSRGTLLYRCIAGRTTCSTCRHSSRRAPSGCGAVPRPAGP